MLVTNYGAKNVLVRGGQKVGDIMIRFVMRASNNVCVFHSIYFWSVSGSIWSGQAGEAACWCWWPATGRWKSLCCVVFHLLHLLSSISRAGCLCADVGPGLEAAQIWTILSWRGDWWAVQPVVISRQRITGQLITSTQLWHRCKAMLYTLFCKGFFTELIIDRQL